MSDMAAIITAIAGVIVPIGGGIAFVWNKIEKRFAHIEGELEECRKREGEAQKRQGIYVAVIELLWSEIKRLHPGDKEPATLDRAKKLLDDLKQ